MEDRKKRIAALAAIMAYLETEQTALSMQPTVPIPENLYYQLNMLYKYLRVMFQ